jgi:hypothetical protein
MSLTGNANVSLIKGWLIQTPRGVHGPFPTCLEAAEHLEAVFDTIVGPAALVPILEPPRRPQPPLTAAHLKPYTDRALADREKGWMR